MLSLDIVDTDLFLEMPSSTQNLYFHFAMRGDDDGFVGSPRKIMKLLGASDDDLKILLSKNYVHLFESGICVVVHWKQHNYIQSDRYHETIYKQDKQLLQSVDGMYTTCIQPVSKMEAEVRLGKVSIGKDKEKEPSFFPNLTSFNPEPRKAGGARIEEAKRQWNLGLTPFRYTAFQIKPDDMTEIMRTLTVYDDLAIKEAINNYTLISRNPALELKPSYPSGFIGFMKSGVEKYTDEAEPFIRCKKESRFMTPDEKEQEAKRKMREDQEETRRSMEADRAAREQEALTDEEKEQAAQAVSQIMQKLVGRK
jgi:hypothetical protein